MQCCCGTRRSSSTRLRRRARGYTTSLHTAQISSLEDYLLTARLGTIRRTGRISLGEISAPRAHLKAFVIRRFDADAVIFAVPPPPVQGLGSTGGFKLFLQDRGAHGYDELARVTAEVLNKARQQRELNPYATYSTFQNSVPQLFADVDRVKAKNQGVPLSNVFDTLQAYLGSVYINDFNRFGRTYRVYAQAEPQFRNQPEDIANLKMRNLRGDMVPMGAVADVRFESGPDRVSHYNVYLASDINGQGSPGTSSSQATAAMERLCQELQTQVTADYPSLATEKFYL